MQASARRSKTPLALLLTILMIAAPLMALATTHHIILNATAEETPSPKLPNINTQGFANPAFNLGPGFPVVVKPGDYFNITLKKPLDSNVEAVYFLSVLFYNNKLHLINETAPNVALVNNTTIRVETPQLHDGLYDIIIQLSNGHKLFIARSVWVLTSLPENVTFMHITDLHFGAGWPNPTIGEYRRFTGYLLSQLLGVNMILNTGDEADTQASSQYLNSIAYRYMLAYSVPMFINPGNHDYPNGGFDTYYEETLGYRVIDGKILIAIINTDGERGYADWHNLKTLQEILETHKNIPFKIVMMHHPIFYYQGQIYTWSGANTTLLGDPHKYRDSVLSYYWGSNITAARFFLKLCEEYNVTLVLAGHIHRDQYVEYHSVKTNTTTYFQTTTTLAHGTGTYQGFQVDEINLVNDTISYPLAPPWFIGYRNYSRTRVYNAIPLTTPEYTQHWNNQLFDHTYIWGTYYEGTTALIIHLENKLPYLNINRTAVLALPWPAGYKVHLKILSSSGGANATIVDQLRVDQLKRTFAAIHFKIPANSSITLALYSEPDNTPPIVQLKTIVPSTPKPGNLVRAFVTVADSGWGVRDAKITVKAEKGKLEQVKVSKYTSNTYMVQFKDNVKGSDTVTITVKAVDYAGNSVTKNVTVNIVSPTITTPQTTTTAAKSTTTTTTTSSTTTSKPASTTSTTSSSTAAATTSTTAAPSRKTTTAIVATGIIVIAALIAGIIYARK